MSKGELLECVAKLAAAGVITSNEESELQDKVEALFQ